MAQIVICCPSPEKMTEQDKRETYNLLDFKKRIKKNKKNVDKIKNLW